MNENLPDSKRKKKKRRTRFTVDLDPELVKALKIRAIYEGRSVSEMIEECISKHLHLS